jgi:hypothetical protein
MSVFDTPPEKGYQREICKYSNPSKVFFSSSNKKTKVLIIKIQKLVKIWLHLFHQILKNQCS